jgi:hypothetical protein
MGVNITNEPVEIAIEGQETFYLQGDPTATPEWETLLEVEVFYSGPKRETSHKELTDAMAGLAETPDDSAKVHALTCGTKTLRRASRGYVEAVTGFPTQPSKSSTRGSRATGGN